MGVYNVVSFCGMFVLLGVAWLLSADRRRMNWRVIGWGIAIQLLVGVFVFIVPAGAKVFLFVNDAVVKVLESASAGSEFVFGRLAIPPGQVGENGEEPVGFMLAFQGFPTIIFFSALVAILYYLRIMPLIIRGFAFVFTKLMRISGAESVVAASNIFVGIESTLTVKPYLSKMTQSELCTVLAAGMATVASNVLALYVFSLQDMFPNIAGHLVSASLMSAPAALVMSKVLFPESGEPVTLGVNVRPYYERENSLFEAIINGSMAGVKMIVGIVALLIAVLGLVELVDVLLGAVGGWINTAAGWNFEWSLRAICGYVFYPFTLVLGVPRADAGVISKMIGERLVVSEVVAYRDLAAVLKEGTLSDGRSAVVATYALCGFAHVASMAIFTGSICGLAPEKARDAAKVAGRALIAATLACLMTGCVAGVFYRGGSILLGP